MSLSQFEGRLAGLRNDIPTGPGPRAVLQRAHALQNALAMLADLAADTLEPDAESARVMLVQAGRRIEAIYRDSPDIADPLAGWRRDVSLHPAADGRELRCHAIRTAERRLRAAMEDIDPDQEALEDYRSSSMSQ